LPREDGPPGERSPVTPASCRKHVAECAIQV
jgi:hypothetical protein